METLKVAVGAFVVEGNQTVFRDQVVRVPVTPRIEAAKKARHLVGVDEPLDPPAPPRRRSRANPYRRRAPESWEPPAPHHADRVGLMGP